MSESDGTSSSTSAFVSTLILYGIIGGAMYIAFSVLRPKQPQVYQPKSMELATVPEPDRPPPVSKGVSSWISDLWCRNRTFLIQYIGIDGYLYTRYIGIFAMVSVVGCVILFPILLPVNATNGLSLDGFEILSFANVTNKNRFYAHVFLSWIFFGGIIWVIYKELVFYISLRHSFQTTPLYDGLLSSRTVLVTDIAENFKSESEIRREFPLANRVWYARDYKELSKLVKERTKLSNKLEGALNGIVKKSVKYKRKLNKKGEPIPDSPKELIQKEPTHRLGKIPFVGEKVNTVDYALKKLPELTSDIEPLQANPESQKQVGSVFLEFPNQLEAQRAYQSLKYNKEFKGDYLIGVAPEDVIWDNLSLDRRTQLGKRTLANTFLTLLILFWAIPVAVVGCISNITFLTEKVPFLRFINNCPDVLLGLITGALPTVLLAILMALVPVIIKAVGRIGGFKTHQQLELYCQSWYFGFQVVQVFLVMTLSSAASSTVTAIINDPSSAMTLLAENLPKASNFYIGYFLLLGLYSTAWTILQAVPLALNHALAFLQNTPRKKWIKQNVLSEPSFGVVYPPQELMVVIMIVYSIISPILLVFTSFALVLFYFIQLYLFTYVNGKGYDMRGRNYPKALFQTFVGLYLAEICLLGLFIMAKSWGPVALEAIILAVTVLAHLYLRYKLERCFDIVPVSAITTARGDPSAYPRDFGWKEIDDVGRGYAESSSSPYVVDDAATFQSKQFQQGQKDAGVNDSNSSRNETVRTDSGEKPKRNYTQDDVNAERDVEKLSALAKEQPIQVYRRFLNPKDGYSFQLVKDQLPEGFNLSPNYSSDYLDGAYNDPAIRDTPLKVWIPRDGNGVSQYEVGKALACDVEVTDEGAIINDEGKLEVNAPPPDYVFEVKH